MVLLYLFGVLLFATSSICEYHHPYLDIPSELPYEEYQEYYEQLQFHKVQLLTLLDIYTPKYFHAILVVHMTQKELELKYTSIYLLGLYKEALKRCNEEVDESPTPIDDYSYLDFGGLDTVLKLNYTY